MPLTREQQDRIVRSLYAIPGLEGVPIGMYDGDRSVTLAQGTNAPRATAVFSIILEESAARAMAGGGGSRAFMTPYPSISATPSHARTTAPRVETRPPETHEGEAAAAALRTNGSRVAPELIGAGLSCGFAVIAGVGVFGSAAAAPATAGASTVVTVAAWTGFVTGSAQCLNGLYRAHEVLFNENSTSLDELDNRKWYQVTTFVVDAVGVVSGIPSMMSASRALITRLQARRLLPDDVALRAMNYEARRRAVAEAVERASSEPELRTALLAASEEARRAAAAGGRMASTASRRGATIAMRAIDARLATAVNAAVREALLAYVPVGINALPGDWVGSASGSVNTTGGYIVHLIAGD